MRQKDYKSENLCLAGGVALNCVANGKIEEKEIFVFIFSLQLEMQGAH